MKLQKIKSKKGTSHVEMMISFVIFIGFLIFLFAIFNPLKKTTNPGISDLVFMNLEDNLTKSLSTVSIGVKDGKLTASDSCFSIANITDMECGNGRNLIVKNKTGSIVGSVINQGENKIYIEKINPDNEQFYTLYCSDEIENPKELSLSGGSLIEPYLGTVINKGGFVSPGYWRGFLRLDVGKDYSNSEHSGYEDFEAFVEFDTSLIEDDLPITSVLLNLTVDYYYDECLDETDITLAFSKFRGKKISSYSDPDQNDRLWNDISTGYNNEGFYASNLPGYIDAGEKTLDLGQQGIDDLRSQLSNDFFAIGIFPDSGASSGNDNCRHYIEFNANAGGAGRPKLIVNGRLWDSTEGNCKDLAVDEYALGIITNRNLWSEKNLMRFESDYNEEYSELKDNFIQKVNDFGFIIKEVETGGILFDGQRNIPRGLNVYAKTTLIDVFDENANITKSTINIIVW